MKRLTSMMKPLLLWLWWIRRIGYASWTVGLLNSVLRMKGIVSFGERQSVCIPKECICCSMVRLPITPWKQINSAKKWDGCFSVRNWTQANLNKGTKRVLFLKTKEAVEFSGTGKNAVRWKRQQSGRPIARLWCSSSAMRLSVLQQNYTMHCFI